MNTPHPHRTQLIGTRSKQKARDPRLHAVDVTMVSQGPGCKGQGQGRARRGKGFQPECDPAMRAGASRPSAWCHTQVRGSTGAGPPLWPCGRVGPSCVLPLGSQHVCQHCSAKDTLAGRGATPVHTRLWCHQRHHRVPRTGGLVRKERVANMPAPCSGLSTPGPCPAWPATPTVPSLAYSQAYGTCTAPWFAVHLTPPGSAPRVSSPSLVAGWGSPPLFWASSLPCILPNLLQNHPQGTAQ